MFGFRPLGRVTSSLPRIGVRCKEEVTKTKAHLASGPGCARVPSLHRRSRGTLRRAIPGPSQLSALASCAALPPASMPLNPLHADCARPPEGPQSRHQLLRTAHDRVDTLSAGRQPDPSVRRRPIPVSTTALNHSRFSQCAADKPAKANPASLTVCFLLLPTTRSSGCRRCCMLT
jgi:hypothetical protein